MSFFARTSLIGVYLYVNQQSDIHKPNILTFIRLPVDPTLPDQNVSEIRGCMCLTLRPKSYLCMWNKFLRDRDDQLGVHTHISDTVVVWLIGSG